MALILFPEKDFFRIFNDVQDYRTILLGRIHEREWYGLVYENSDGATFYCPDLVRKFYLGINTDSINLDLNQFIVHLNHGDLLVTLETIEEVTQVPSPPQHITPLPLTEHMTLMGVRCNEQDRGLWENTTFIVLAIGSNGTSWL